MFDKYQKEVIEKLNGKKADFITADGAFDCSEDFNRQEKSSLKLIFSEIVMILSNQKLNGSSVIKVFDILSPLTIKIVYILTMFYEKVTITKPLTSREGNSEKIHSI